jgi:hypothetical protein
LEQSTKYVALDSELSRTLNFILQHAWFPAEEPISAFYEKNTVFRA